MKYIINIPEPCQEDWNKMPLKGDGRYCDVCEKTIYDFTNLSNRELVNKLENGENICGRYRQSQLNVDLFANKNKGISKWMYLLGITSLFTINTPVFSQTNDSITTVDKLPKDNGLIIDQPSQTDKIIVKGVVNDEIGPLPGVNIIVQGTNLTTETDFDGKFSLVIKNKIGQQKFIVEFNYVGYETQYFAVTKDIDIEIMMVSDESNVREVVVVGGICVTKVRKDNIFRKIGRWFKRKDKK